jgi:hypothetical protein
MCEVAVAEEVTIGEIGLDQWYLLNAKNPLLIPIDTSTEGL